MPVRQICSADELANELHDAGNNLVIVEFFATWCGHCQHFAPELEALSRAEPKCIFLKVDVDACSDLAQYYGIHSMPTTIIFQQGQYVDTVSGADIDVIKQKIDAFEVFG
jgi:thioredoxin